jgi:apolipoprotein N-acyltransferase
MTGASIEAPPIRLANLVWVAIALAVTAAVSLRGSLWALTFVHVFAGLLWTGIDLFLGFVLGPILRAVGLPARRAVALRLLPRTLFLLPTLAAVTGTAGWFLAGRLGLLGLPWPQFGWIAAALAILAVLTVQGLGILLPVNLLVYFELRKPEPDGARIGRLMGRYVRVVAVQGVMQVAMIAVMTRLATGV